MQVIKPVTFNKNTMLVSTTATETVPAWSSATTYNADAEVLYNDNIYVSLQGSNTNKQPDTNPTWWLLKQAGNRMAMFDDSVSTRTTATSSLQVVLNTGMINSIAFLNISGNTLTVTATESPSGPVVYSKTIDLDSTIITNWYEYFFEPYALLSDVVLTDIPPYSGMRMTVQITTGPTSEVAIGNLVFGTLYTLGQTQYGVSVGIRDFSIKETDDFGNVRLLQRSYSKRMNAQIFVPNNNFNKLNKILADLRAAPAVYIGTQDERFNQAIVYGYYRDYDVVIQYPGASLCSIEIEGLI